MNDSDRIRDEWLALRCQAGDVGAFEDLVAVMERPLLFYLSRLVGAEHEVLDVLQEVWIKAFRDIRHLRNPGSLRPWLYRIAHGLAVDHVRRDVSREHAEEVHAGFSEASEEISFSLADTDSMYHALGQLDPIHREVLMLHFLEDFSVAAIADAVSCPEGTVKSRLYHAKRKMRSLLSGDPDASE
ncbi:MAG: RNA polymerase sigma factor [Gemmatimonadota bacterium]